MSGVKYLQNPTAGDTAQPFQRRQVATAPVARVSTATSPGSSAPVQSPVLSQQIPPPIPCKQSAGGETSCQKQEREATGTTPKPKEKWHI